MKICIRFLLASMILLQGVPCASSQKRKVHSKTVLIAQEKNIFEQALDHENDKVGAKIGYAGAACQAYQDYVEAFLNGNVKESDIAWQNFQKYRNKMKEVPTPYVSQLFYGGFGYWLYSRMAYPMHKKNWGFVKKTAAKIIIPAWLFKDALLPDVYLVKKHANETQELGQEIVGLQEKNNMLVVENESLKKEREQNLCLFGPVLEKWKKMTEQERNDWMSSEKKQEEGVVLKDGKKALEEDASNQEQTVLPNPLNGPAALLGGHNDVNNEFKEASDSGSKKEPFSWKRELGWYRFRKFLRL